VSAARAAVRDAAIAAVVLARTPLHYDEGADPATLRRAAQDDGIRRQ